MPSRLEDLEAELSSLKTEVAGLKATVAMMKWSVSVVGLVLGIVTAIGGWDYLKTRAELRSSIAEAERAAEKASKAHTEVEAIRRGFAEVLQTEIIEQIERRLGEQSLDALRRHSDILGEVRTLGVKLKAASGRVDPPNQTTFGFIVDALEYFVREDYPGALTQLDRVVAADRQRFVHAQMRGTCLLRLDRRAEAAREFNRASGLALGRRQSLALNLRGTAELFEWRISKEREKLLDAVRTFEQIIRQDPTFPTAYLNLALTFAQFGPDRYGRVTELLVLPEQKGIRTLSDVAAIIVEDLNRPSEGFLKEYVNERLGLRPPYSSAAIAEALTVAAGSLPKR